MAKKPRTQVDYNPGQASLQGGVGASAGNYRVAVAPTPKTNAALQFASFINQVPNVAGQYTNYIEAIGQEKLAMMTEDELEQELAGGDKKTLNILKYNKAYNYGLVEKNFKRNIDTYQKRFDDMAGMIENYADNDTFLAAMDEEAAAIGSEFLEKTANEYQRKAGEALLFNALPTLRAKSLEKYQAFKQQATIEQGTAAALSSIAQETQLSPVENVNKVFGGFKSFLNQFSDIEPAQKSRLLEQLTYNAVAMFEARGQENEAVAFLEAAGAYEIYKGARLGQIGDNTVQFERLRQSLIEVETEKTETNASIRTRGSANARALFFSALDNIPEEEWKKKVADYVKSVGVYEAEDWVEGRTEEIAQAVLNEKTNTEKLRALSLAMSRMTDSTENQDTVGFINATSFEYEKARREWTSSTSFYGPDLNQVRGQMDSVFQENPFIKKEDVGTLTLEDGKRVEPTSKAFGEVWNEITKNYPYRSIKGLEERQEDLVKELIEEKPFGNAQARFASDLGEFITDHERNIRIFNKTKGPNQEDNFKAELLKEATDFRDVLLERHKSNNTFQQDIKTLLKSEAPMSQEEQKELKQRVQAEADKEGIFGIGKGKTFDFKSLKSNFNASNREEIIKDRNILKQEIEGGVVKQEIKTKAAREALLFSLQEYGVQSVEEFDSSVFQKANSGTNAVYLVDVKIGQTFLDQLENAAIYAEHVEGLALQKPSVVNDAKKSYDLVVDRLFADESREINLILKLLEK